MPAPARRRSRLADLVLYTVNGPTRWNEVRIARGAVFVPVSSSLAVGAEYGLHSHRNVFPGGQENRTSRQARLLLDWTVFSGRP